MTKKPIPSGFRNVPNVGPAMAEDFVRLGFTSLAQLKGKDPQRLYEKLCRMDGVKHDVCVLDTFAAVVDQAAGRPAKPWWIYSRKRLARSKAKARESRRAAARCKRRYQEA